MKKETINPFFIKNFNGITYRATIDLEPISIDGQLEKITGYDKETFMQGSLRWDEIIHSEDRYMLLDYLEQVRNQNDFSHQLCYRIIRKDGSVGVVREYINNLPEEKGKPAMIEGVIYDVTEEMTLQKDLEFSNRYLKTILDTDTNLIATTIKGEKLQSGNRSLFEFFGYKDLADFHLEHNCICEFFEPEEKAGFVRESMDGVNWLDYILSRPDSRHKVLIKRNGEEHIFSIKANEMPFDELERSVVVLSEITETERYQESLQKQVEEEIRKRRAQEELLINQSKIAAMGEMMSAIAHHWRQPLNIIGLQIQDVKYAYSLNEIDEAYVERFVHIAMREVEAMTKTIDDFRNFFKAEDSYGPFDVQDQISSAQKILGGVLQNNRIILTVEQKAMKLTGRPSEFIQVIVNALANSNDAILRRREREPGLEGKIDIFLHEQGGKKVIMIRDNGGGIDEGILDKVFEPYFTTKFQSRGTGISLYMSKIIIERNMNGSIYVRNIDGGCEFVIEFEGLNLKCDI